MIGNIYGYWGPGWNAKWEAHYQPKEKTLLGRTYDVMKHAVLLGGQLTLFSAAFIAITSQQN